MESVPAASTSIIWLCWQMFYSLRNPKAQVRAFVEDSLRGRCAFLDVDEIFKAKQEIADHVR